MNAKLIIFCAGLALATAASVPHLYSKADPREAFETEDALYLPISDDEAEFLRLPRENTKLPHVPLIHGHGPSLTFIQNDESIRESLLPSISHHYNGRVRRSVEPVVVETEDAYYVPVTSDEAEELGLPQNIPDLADSSDDSNVEIISDEEVLRINPSAVTSSSDDSSSRPKRQVFVQGGGSPKQGFDVYAQGRAKLWESDNKRNTVHGTAQYSQHLGGPYGNSRPNVGTGLTFTHRF